MQLRITAACAGFACGRPSQSDRWASKLDARHAGAGADLDRDLPKITTSGMIVRDPLADLKVPYASPVA
jgi:hypothetical protein